MNKNSCYNYGDNLFVYLAGDLNTSPEYLRHLLRTKTLNIDACNEEGDRALHRATRIGRINLVRILIEYKANPDLLNNNNYTALDLSKQYNQVNIINLIGEYQRFYSLSPLNYNYLYAALKGNLTEVKNSLKNGAILDTLTRDLANGLHLALEGEHFSIAEYLVKRKINTSAQDFKGNTPLHYSAIIGNHTFSKTLIKQSNLNILNNNNHTSTDLALQNNHSEVLNMLIKYQRFYSLSPWDTSFLYAVKIGNFSEVKNSLEHGADPYSITPELETALHIAAISGNVKIVEYLIDYYHLDVNALDVNQATPIHYATMNNNDNARKVIIKLLQAGANINLNCNDGYSFLYKISHRGYHEIVNIALKNVTNINEASNNQAATALHAAAMNNHLKIIYLLVAKGIDITLRTLEGKTAFTIARESSFLEIAEYLRSKTTQLISASANGKVDLVNSMLAKHVDIDSSEHYGYTALDMAVKNGHENMVVFLLDHGAKIKISLFGTSLHIAAREKYYKIMDILIDHGASLTFPDFLGTTPADIAPEYKYYISTEQLLLVDTTTYLDNNADF